jgi:glycosidase
MKTGIRLLLALAVLVLSASAQAPRITKIDPPNWWAGMPDPMLLVYGEGLHDARFSVAGTGVQLLRQQASENGHYAFLWLSGRNSSPQQLQIEARNSEGAARATYDWKPRPPSTGRYQGFSSADVMYLIMTDRFADGDPSNDQPGYDPAKPRGWHGGDFQGISQHLDYLQSLGVTTLWTTPVTSNAGMPESYHGYASVDLYALDSHFGTLADYQRLAAELHGRGMKIVLDIVPNHIGVLHPWVKDPPTPDWLHGTLANHVGVKFNFDALVDPHASPASSYDITHGWFTDDMPDLNQENPLVSQYLIQNVMWWIETAGIDGLRIDTFQYVGRAFWQDFHRALHSVYPNLTSVGEVLVPDPTITSFFAGGVERLGIDTGLTTPFDYPVYFALRDVLLHDKPMTALTEILRQDSLYPHPERLVFFFGNHDQKRFLSEPGATPAKLKLAFGLLATLRGMPEMYSGDEIGMLGGDDPDNRRDFPGGFSKGGASGFAASNRTAGQEEMFAWASELFHLRAQHPALQTGQQQNVFADETTLAYVRSGDTSHGCESNRADDRVFVVVNKAAAPRRLSIPIARTALDACTIFNPIQAQKGPAITVDDHSISLLVPPGSVFLYQVQ